MNANIGQLNSGKCYVFLFGMDKDAFYGSEAECEAMIAKYGVVDAIPVIGENGEDLTNYPKDRAEINVAAPPKYKPKKGRNYSVTIEVLDYVAGWSTGKQDAGDVYAYDRNEAMRKARDLGRDLIGPYGPRYKVSVKLA